MAKITYTNKVTLNPQPSIADENKVTSGNMNEIKSSVNTLYDNQGDLSSLQTTTKSSLVGAVNELKSGEVYSSSEVKTNKVWIDGKPIYRKVLQYTYSTTGTHQESLSSFNIDTITSYNWNCLVNNTYIINAYDFQDNNAKCNLFFDKKKIYMINGTTWTLAKFTLILEYTKTTD